MFNFTEFRKAAGVRISTLRGALTEEALESCYVRAAMDALHDARVKAGALRQSLGVVKEALAQPRVRHKDGSWVMMDRAQLDKIYAALDAADRRIREFEASF